MSGSVSRPNTAVLNAVVMNAIRALARERDRRVIADTLLSFALEQSTADRATLQMKNETHRCVKERAARTLRVVGGELPGEPAPAALVEAALGRGEPVAIADTRSSSWAAEPCFPARGPRSVLCLPLMHGTNAVAVLTVETPDVTGGFPAPIQAALRALGDYAAGRLELARLAEAIRRTEADQRTTRKAIADAEASIAASQRISRTGSWSWDPADETSGEWSLEVFHLLGYDPATTKPSFALNLARVHPDDRERYLAEASATVRNGLRFDIAYRYLLPGGRVRHVRALGRRVSSRLYVGTVHDLTDRRTAEDALRRAHTELARVSRLTTVGELAASITHELNQPLTSIVAHAGATLRWLNRDAPDLGRVRFGVQAIIEDSRRARDVVASLHALARKSEPELAPFVVDDAIREVQTLTQSEMGLHGITLQVELAAGSMPVRGDRVQIQQVMLGLLTLGISALKGGSHGAKDILVATGPAGTFPSASRCGAGASTPPLSKHPSTRLTPAAKNLGWALPSAAPSCRPTVVRSLWRRCRRVGRCST